MTQVAIFPGTFDPITLGHQDILRRTLPLFDKVIVAIATQPEKNPLFDIHTRVQIAQSALSSLMQSFPHKLEIEPFSELLVTFARQKNAHVILRGLRSGSDFDYEWSLSRMNHAMAPDIETLLIAPSPEFAFISSSLIRQIAARKGDIAKFVAPAVAAALLSRFGGH